MDYPNQLNHQACSVLVWSFHLIAALAQHTSWISLDLIQQMMGIDTTYGTEQATRLQKATELLANVIEVKRTQPPPLNCLHNKMHHHHFN